MPLLQGMVAPRPGYPRIIRSEELPGMNPGFHIVLLGVCGSTEAEAAVALLKGLGAGAYARALKGPAEASCPERAQDLSAGKSWSLADASGARLSVTAYEHAEVTDYVAVGRSSDLKRTRGVWLPGSGKIEGPEQADCTVQVAATKTRLTLTRRCTGIFRNMCQWPDRTEVSTYELKGEQVVENGRETPGDPKPIGCGE